MLLLDGVNRHANISHPVSGTRDNGSRALVSETVISVEEHEGICKPNFFNPWAASVVKLQIIKEVINSLNAILTTEKSCRALS